MRLNFSLAERVGYPLKECQTFKAEAMAEGADVTRRMAVDVWKLWSQGYYDVKSHALFQSVNMNNLVVLNGFLPSCRIRTV